MCTLYVTKYINKEAIKNIKSSFLYVRSNLRRKKEVDDLWHQVRIQDSCKGGGPSEILPTSHSGVAAAAKFGP